MEDDYLKKYRDELWFHNKHQEKLNKIRDLVFEILNDAVKEGIDIEYAVSMTNSIRFILQWSLDHEKYRKRILKRLGLDKYFEEEVRK